MGDGLTFVARATMRRDAKAIQQFLETRGGAAFLDTDWYMRYPRGNAITYLDRMRGSQWSEKDEARAESLWLRQVDQEVRGKHPGLDRVANETIVRRLLSQRMLTLYLGAGTSMGPPAWLPDWQNLVCAILDIAASEGHPQSERDAARITKELLTSGSADEALTLTLATEVAKGALGAGFVQSVLWYLESVLADRVPQPPITAVHEAICNLAQESAGLARIITYNFDDLLEQALAASEVKHTAYVDEDGALLRLRYSPEHRLYEKVGSDQDAGLQIFHVHGVASRNMGSPHNDLVFSELSYRRSYYGMSSGFTPVTGSEFLYNGTALFVGCSLKDRFVVAQLSAAGDSSPGAFHYALLARQGVAGSAETAEKQQDRERRRLLELNTRVLWVDKFEDVGPYLARLGEGRGIDVSR